MRKCSRHRKQAAISGSRLKDSGNLGFLDVQSDGNNFTAKIHHFVVLIEYAQLHVINDLEGDRKVNDLRWNFDDLISWRYGWEKFVSRMNLALVYVRSRSDVALDSQGVDLEDSYT